MGNINIEKRLSIGVELLKVSWRQKTNRDYVTVGWSREIDKYIGSSVVKKFTTGLIESEEHTSGAHYYDVWSMLYENVYVCISIHYDEMKKILEEESNYKKDDDGKKVLTDAAHWSAIDVVNRKVKSIEKAIEELSIKSFGRKLEEL